MRCTECGEELDPSVDVVIHVDAGLAAKLKGGDSKDPICEDCAAKLLVADAECSGPFTDARGCPVHRKDLN